MYVAAADTATATIIIFETFNDSYETYKPAFDEIVKSVKLARTPAPRNTDTMIIEEQPHPSETMRMVSGKGWTMGVPDNFSKEKGYFLGKRRGDCYLKVDVKPIPENASKESHSQLPH